MTAESTRRPDPIEPWLDGTRLWGDDFGPDDIAAWYADEAEAYAALDTADTRGERYLYHAWNRLHGFGHLEAGSRFAHVLAFGSAYGDELEAIAGRMDRITVVDPSEAFDGRTEIAGVPIERVRPAPSGDLELPDGAVDLVTCFGVLHHIPNVSHVVAELARATAPGGHLLVREPIVSMGDWRRPRPGLTSRERGVPVDVLRRACTAAGLVVERETLCGFSLTPRLLGPFVTDVYNSPAATRADAAACRLAAGRVRYHATSAWQKLRPTSVFLVLRKGGSAGR